MTRVLLIRHGLTDTAGIRITGQMPGISLNEAGRIQVRQLAERLSAFPVTAVYSSPLERAMETAVAVSKIFNLPVNISRDFLEADFGQWTNKTIEELRDDRQFSLFNSFRSGTRIPGGEMMTEVQLRVITGLEKIKSQHRDETVAVVSHADPVKAAVAWYAGIHMDLMQRLEIDPASVSILDFHDETVRIILVNGMTDLPY